MIIGNDFINTSFVREGGYKGFNDVIEDELDTVITALKAR